MTIFGKLSDRVGDFFEEVLLPEEVRRAHVSAAEAIRQEQFSEAAETLVASLESKEDCAQTHHMLGVCQFHLQNYPSAYRSAGRAISLREHATSHHLAAQCCGAQGEFRNARRHLVAALKTSDADTLAFEIERDLAQTYESMGRPDRAAIEWERVLELRPGYDEGRLSLARCRMQRGEFEEARAVLEPALEREPIADMWVLSGDLAMKFGEETKAKEAYRRAIAGDADHTLAKLRLTRLLLDSGQGELAAAQLEAISSFGLVPRQRVQTHILKGEIGEFGGRLDLAWTHYEAALGVDDTAWDAELGLARLEIVAERYEAASNRYRRVLEDGGDGYLASASKGLGRCRAELGDLAGARHDLEDALRLEPQDWEALYLYGRVAVKAGDIAEAVVFFQDALDHVGPGDRQAILDDRDEALEELRPTWTRPTRLEEPALLIRCLDGLVTALSGDPKLTPFHQRVQEIRRELDAPLSVAIVGEFNAGKSTLVNALIGEEVVPTGVLPTTAQTGIIGYGPRRAARIVYEDGTLEELAFEDASERLKADQGGIERVEFLFPHPKLRTVRYWDTPGFNALDERHESLAAHALHSAEAVLWVLDANQVLSSTEFEKIHEFPSASERLLVVMNKIDRLGVGAEREEQVEELYNYIQEHIGESIAGCFPLSALEFLRARTGEEDASVDAAFAAFENTLDRVFLNRAGRIKTLESSRHLDRLLGDMGEFRRALLHRYSKNVGVIEEVLAWLDETAQGVPTDVDEEVRRLEDGVAFALEGIRHEVAEALKPTGALMTRLVLSADDEKYLRALLIERLDVVLKRSNQRVVARAVGFESEIASRMEAVFSELPLEDARLVNQRLQGLFDRTNVHRLLLSERLYGSLLAQAEGRSAVSPGSMADGIDVEHGVIASLMPPISVGVSRDLSEWYREFFSTVDKGLYRIIKDVERQSLEAQFRYSFGNEDT
jgi:small GTP-binding protein